MRSRKASKRKNSIIISTTRSKTHRRLAKLGSEEDKLKASDLEIQQELLAFGQTLDEATKKSANAKRKIDNEEKV